MIEGSRRRYTVLAGARRVNRQTGAPDTARPSLSLDNHRNTAQPAASDPAAIAMADTYKEYLAARVLSDNRPVSSSP
jgi:hypothetical protein